MKSKTANTVVLIQNAWIHKMNLDHFFGISASGPGFVTVAATELTLLDGFFAAVTFSPTKLNGRPTTLYVPKEEIIGAVSFDNAEDAAAIGFQSQLGTSKLPE